MPSPKRLPTPETPARYLCCPHLGKDAHITLGDHNEWAGSEAARIRRQYAYGEMPLRVASRLRGLENYGGTRE